MKNSNFKADWADMFKRNSDKPYFVDKADGKTFFGIPAEKFGLGFTKINLILEHADVIKALPEYQAFIATIDEKRAVKAIKQIEREEKKKQDAVDFLKALTPEQKAALLQQVI